MADDPFAPPPTDSGAQAAQPVDPIDPNTWGGDGYPLAPDEVQNAMKELVYNTEQENSLARLAQVRDILLNREFDAGRQVVFWSANENRYKVPTADQLGITQEEFDDITITINVFTGYVRIVMAELSQSPPRTAFGPSHAQVQADVRLANDAQDIVGFINRENKVDEKLPYRVRLLCLDGGYAEYTRFVRDPKYGIEDYEVEEGYPVEVELQQSRAVCPECTSPTRADLPEDAPSACPMPGCGAPMGPATFAPRVTAMRQPKVTKQRPAGKEVMDVVGMLEMVIPSYEKDEEELGFLTWCREVHKNKLMAIFPEAADKIETGGPGGNSSTSSNERIARLSLLGGYRYSDGQGNLITFRETWMRPFMYEGLRQKFGVATRDNFRKWFPDGFRVAFAGDVYCGSWAEKLEDHWTITHATPGDGQYRGAIARDAVPSQRHFNKCNSIKMETFEGGLPFTMFDTDVWHEDALGGRTQANALYGGQGRGNKTVQNSVWQSTPTQVSEQMIRYQEELRGDIMQHQFGAFSALYGGDLKGNDTKGGIQIERNAAKGVQGLFYRAMKNGRARADMKNLRLFLANRTQDVEIAVEGPGSEWDSVKISLADIRDGNVSIKEDADESFPVSLNEQRDQLSAMVNNENPVVMGWFNDIGNAAQYVDIIGMSELIRVPGADAREKAFDIIAELVKAAPILPPSPPMYGGAIGGSMVDTMSGPPPPPMMPPDAGMGLPGAMPPPMPVPPQPPEPSIQPDPVLDSLDVYVKTCQEWAASAAGRKAQLETPDGYANVRAFAAKCLTLLAPPPMPMPAPGDAGGNGGPPGGHKALPSPPEATGPLPAMGIQ